MFGDCVVGINLIISTGPFHLKWHINLHSYLAVGDLCETGGQGLVSLARALRSDLTQYFENLGSCIAGVEQLLIAVKNL
jgi:hypothetical protein